MAHIIQLALGAFMSSLGVKGCTKSWEANERDQQFGENEGIDNGKSKRLRNEGNARIKKVSAMRPGLAKIIEKVRTSRYFESPGIDLHKAENACCIDYANTWSLKRVHCLSKSQSPYCSTCVDECEDTLELNIVVAWAGLPIAGIHIRVASTSTIEWIPATLHNSEWMDHCKVCDGSVEAVPILDPVDVDEAYSYIAWHYQSIQWHVQSHAWHNASFGQEADSPEGRHVLRLEVSSTEAVQIQCWSVSINRYASHFSTYIRFFLEVAIVQEVGPGNGYKS